MDKKPIVNEKIKEFLKNCTINDEVQVDVHVQQLRSIIPIFIQELLYGGESIVTKVKGKYSRKPSGWNEDVAFIDPNNKPKPDKPTLVSMTHELIRLYRVKNENKSDLWFSHDEGIESRLDSVQKILLGPYTLENHLSVSCILLRTLLEQISNKQFSSFPKDLEDWTKKKEVLPGPNYQSSDIMVEEGLAHSDGVDDDIPSVDIFSPLRKDLEEMNISELELNNCHDIPVMTKVYGVVSDDLSSSTPNSILDEYLPLPKRLKTADKMRRENRASQKSKHVKEDVVLNSSSSMEKQFHNGSSLILPSSVEEINDEMDAGWPEHLKSSSCSGSTTANETGMIDESGGYDAYRPFCLSNEFLDLDSWLMSENSDVITNQNYF